MSYKNIGKNTLAEYLEVLQAKGQYSFTKKEAIKVLECGNEAFDRAVRRLEQKKRLAVIKPGFLTITPIEYKNWGVIPPDWFINSLMSYLSCPYYVGLLSAASLYGAAHQQPQQFQVITNKIIRKITKKRTNIWFFKKEHVIDTPVKEIQTHTGRMRVSIPEATALDLVKFYKKSGYLSNVATVLSELIESMDKNILVETAQNCHYELPVIQRLGYLLSCKEVGGENMAEGLFELVSKIKPRFIPLASYKGYDENITDEKWRIFINEQIEVDV